MEQISDEMKAVILGITEGVPDVERRLTNCAVACLGAKTDDLGALPTGSLGRLITMLAIHGPESPAVQMELHAMSTALQATKFGHPRYGDMQAARAAVNAAPPRHEPMV
ncbi:MAG TPA: hypothetical protein VFZ66_29680 [Herpetosiphonaceae bacterium]